MKRHKLHLFVDDLRDTNQVVIVEPDCTYPYERFGWIVARNYDTALRTIISVRPQKISFDHDLGEERTGMDLAKKLVELDMDDPDKGFIQPEFEFTSHSANIVGRDNIEQYLHSYMMQKYDISGLYKTYSLPKEGIKND